MVIRKSAVSAVAIATLLSSTSASFAATEISWWHGMRVVKRLFRNG